VDFLRKLKSDAKRVSAKSGDTSGFRFTLVKELQNAAEQYGLNPSKDNLEWFETLGVALGRLENVEKKKSKAVVKSQKAGEQLQRKRFTSDVGPLWKLHNARSDAAFQCSEAGVASAACSNVKKLNEQIVELHRKGLKLPPQPKGSSVAAVEEWAAKEAKKLGKKAVPAKRPAPVKRPAPAKRPTASTKRPAPKATLRLDVQALRKAAERTIAQAQRTSAGQPARIQARVDSVVTQALQPSTDLLSLLLSASKMPVTFPQGSPAATLLPFVR
jgi:hypothetical protein